jgi:Dolichyl-phosphate-mannose-protein mannosyltransferase
MHSRPWRRVAGWGLAGWGLAGLALCLFAAWHALSLRWEIQAIPTGDEGSWMAVAAQWARGEGYTTRWLEFHWLEPYALPRPNDFRYPALTTLLGLSFKLFGIHHAVALKTVAAVFLLTLTLLYAYVARRHGRMTALMAVSLAAFSLQQLQWNSLVYTEGLFGLVLVLVVMAARRVATSRAIWPWCLVLGLTLGVLYLVRPNGLLWAAGVPGLIYAVMRGNSPNKHQERTTVHNPFPWLKAVESHAWVAIGFLIAAGPWLWRTFRLFGNPLHIAGSAGLMRETLADSPAADATSFLGQHGPGYFADRLYQGLIRLIADTHQFEHGLAILPIALALLRLYLDRRKWRHGTALFFLPGLLLTVAACAYAAKNSWAGARYLSPVLPLLYAYGLSLLPLTWRKLTSKPILRSLRPRQVVFTTACLAVLLAPVVGPHRFYQRQYGGSHALQEAGAQHAIHARDLHRFVADGSTYYAGYLCQLNFMGRKLCVGLQELHHTDWVAKSERAFRPEILVMARHPIGVEREAADMSRAMTALSQSGCQFDTLGSNETALYLRVLRPDTGRLGISGKHTLGSETVQKQIPSDRGGNELHQAQE